MADETIRREVTRAAQAGASDKMTDRVFALAIKGLRNRRTVLRDK